MLVPLAVLGLAVGSYADCSKNEIFKLLDKGYSKTEVDGICNKSKSSLKWITPTQEICKANGGKMDRSKCKSNWENAKKICKVSGGILPTVEIFRQVVRDCTGVYYPKNNIEWEKNVNNSFYQNCYKKRGLSSDYFWSITTYNDSWVWGAGLYNGHIDWFSKSEKFRVICVQ